MLEVNVSKDHTTEDNYSYLGLPLKKKLSLINEIFRNSLPNIAAYATPHFANLISVYFLSQYNDDMVAGYGLGAVFTGAFVLALVFSFNQAGNVLMAQAFGAKNYKACGIYFQRSALLLVIILSPLLISLFYADRIFIFFGIDENLAKLVLAFTKIMAPTMIGSSCFDLLKAFIISQKVFTPIIYIQGFAVILHFLWAKLFIDWLQLGIEGAALCRLIGEWTSAIIMYIYIKKSDRFRDTWIPWSKEALDKDALIQQVKFSIPISAMTYIGWVYFEVMTIIAGTYGSKQVVTHVAVGNTSSLNYNMDMGISTTIMTYVANSIGKQSVIEAKNYFYSGMSLLGMVTIVNFTLLQILKEPWIGVWTTDPQTATYLFQVLTVYQFTTLIADNVNNGLLGFLKAVGKQKVASLLVFVALYPLGIPLMILFTFILDYQVKGLWISFGIATVIQMFATVFIVGRVDWKNIMAESKQRLADQEMKVIKSYTSFEDKKEGLLHDL